MNFTRDKAKWNVATLPWLTKASEGDGAISCNFSELFREYQFVIWMHHSNEVNASKVISRNKI